MGRAICALFASVFVVGCADRSLLLKVDIYMKYWCDLVVEYELTSKGKPTRKRRIHAYGGHSSWSASGYEFYPSIRDTEQQMMWILFEDLEAAG